MTDLFSQAAENFLELASHQRLQIIFKLLENKSTPTIIARELNVTKQEAHRNFSRLEKSGLIEKDNDGKYIKVLVKTLEKWKSIYKNANEYIYEILSEVPLDLLEPLVKQIKKGVKFQYIFSESVIVPEGRKALLKKLGFYKLIEKGIVERKMIKNVHTVLVLNEK